MNRRTGDKIAISGNYQYNAYYHGRALQRFWHRFKINTAIKDLDIQPGKNILDAGCGSGMLSAMIAMDNPSVRVTGMDGNTAAIAFCKQQWEHLPNAQFVPGQIDELQKFPDASLDGIAFLEVIEHITTQQATRVLHEFYRILHTGGLLVVSSPNRKSLWPLLESIMDTFRLAPNLKLDQHEQLYSGSELLELARQNGFTPARCQRINFIAPWAAILFPIFAERIHAWETRQTWLPGPLLLYTFIKK